MPRTEETVVENLPEFEAWLDRIAGRAVDIEPALHEVISVIEHAEQALFGSFGGKYNQTGETMASLTSSQSEEAIRDVHGDELVFGTMTWWARFQGTEDSPKGGQHRGPSAILKITPDVQMEANLKLMEYILSGDAAGAIL
jgi:hypothetical protein